VISVGLLILFPVAYRKADWLTIVVIFYALGETPKQDRDKAEHCRKNNASHLPEHTIKIGKLVKGASASPKRQDRRNAEDQRRSSE